MMSLFLRTPVAPQETYKWFLKYELRESIFYSEILVSTHKQALPSEFYKIYSQISVFRTAVWITVFKIWLLYYVPSFSKTSTINKLEASREGIPLSWNNVRLLFSTHKVVKQVLLCAFHRNYILSGVREG